MSMRNRNHNQNLGGRGERTILRAVLVLGLVAAGGLWYLTRGVGGRESLFLPGLVGVAVVASVIWFGRVRARERWEAAWDAYVASDGKDDNRIDLAQEDGVQLSLAGSR